MACYRNRRSIGEAPITRQSKGKMSHHPHQRRVIRPVVPNFRQFTISGQPENYEFERDIVMRNVYDSARTGWKQLQILMNAALKFDDQPLVNTIVKNLAPVVLDNDPNDRTLWFALQMGDVQTATQLVCAGTDLNRRHPGTGATYLHWLASKVDKDYYELATMMMDYGADVNANDKLDNSVLHVAAEYGLPNMVDELVKRNANIDIVNKSGQSVVYTAAKSGRADGMLSLLIGYSRDAATRNKRCIDAFYALTDVNAGYQQIRKLLDMGFPLDQYGRKGSTLLYEAVFEKKIELVKLLLEYGADVNKKLRNSKLPLHPASQQKDPRIFKLLIAKGASVNDCSDDYNGQFPIHGACKHESLANIKLLLQLGADVNVLDKNGRTPFSLLPTENFTDLQASIIKYIAITVAKVNVVNQSDLVKIRANLDMQDYYEKCLGELQTMKDIKVHDNDSFFCFFNTHMINLSIKWLEIDFIKNLDDYQNKLKDLFPVYHEEIQHLSIQVEKAKCIVKERVEIVKKFVINDMEFPDHVVALIVFYSCIDDIKKMQRDYYISS